uniref:Cytochrome b n=1 Tax=Halocynthia aurantium TaxID=254849 RepID=A0A7L8Y3M4_HALAU|nr:cytochrome b [Halocynthia aurantium]QOI13836.1 cytochrome b [Halocynthia aurantium]
MGLFLDTFAKLPSPVNLSYWWNWGSMVGVLLVGQILTGLFLTMHYVSDVAYAFDSVVHIHRDVSYGWVVRSVHANGASVFMFGLYMHVGRGLYYKSFLDFRVWYVGVILLVVSMLTSFVGYVLPWGQMSFWGATVITNLLSAVPLYGVDIVYWVWGGFSVGAPTLTRFYTFHFIFPFLIAVLSLVHLVFLHSKGSTNPLKIATTGFKVSFWPYFGIKDIYGFLVVFWVLYLVVGFFPDVFGDPDNFMKANPMVTPLHIKPEWYFLFAYAILRCIPSKGLGVLALVLSIVFFFIMPVFSFLFGVKKKGALYPVVFWVWSINFVLLTWLGGSPVEPPYVFLAQVSSVLYFILLFLLCVI